ncbi:MULTISPECIES: hypothetical protein [Alphaproteobacteria]|uniref:hypothetical protein n=1 Tax=Alphaproteobacteria TaxID=28211 RepID=UPI003298228F
MARRKRRGNKASQIKTVAYGFGAFLIAGTAGYLALSNLGKAQPNAIGCLPDPRQAQTVVFLDASVGYDQSQTRDLRKIAEDIYWRALHSNERLRLITTEEQQIASVVTPRVDFCRTASDPRDLERLGAASATPAYLAKEAQDAFENLYEPFFDEFLNPDAGPAHRQVRESPILEQIQSISRLPGFGDGGGNRRLVVISDGIQNTPEAQFCHVRGALPAFDTFATRPYFERVRPHDLSGVKVTFYMAIQHGYGSGQLAYCTEDELRNFWLRYFEAAGAQSVEIVRLRRGVDWNSGGGL